jgi:hypothetical protein
MQVSWRNNSDTNRIVGRVSHKGSIDEMVDGIADVISKN